MSGPGPNLNAVPRGHWPRALMALQRERVAEAIGRISGNFEVRLIKRPEAGLGLLKFKESALNESFYLGEFPVATSSVELTLSDGEAVRGAAQVLDDDADYATLLAIADAVLANELTGSDELMGLVALGEEVLAREQSIRQAMLARTKVDFSLLSMAEGEDE